MNSRICRTISKQAGGCLGGKAGSGVVTSVLFALVVLIFVAALAFSADHTPKYLEPVPPHSPLTNGYEDLVLGSLIKDRFPEAWMMVLPSFQPEYAVALRKVDPEDSTDVYFEVEYAVADESVWNWKDEGDGTMSLDLRKNAAIIRQAARLPADLATSLLDTWKAVIMKTRYADKDWMGLDGVTYEFYVSRGLYGQTWSPDSGIPKMMVDCGQLLIDYAKGNDSDRPKIADRLRRSIAEIEKALD